MSRINVYLPDELAEAVKRSDLNVSAVVQHALRNALDRAAMGAWLDSLADLDPVEVSVDEVVSAVEAGRDELGL